MSQLHAGYVFDSVKSLFDKTHYKNEIKPLLEKLSQFETSFEFPQNYASIHPQTGVLHNIITRGRTTRPSVYIEELFSIYLKQTERTTLSDKINFPFTDSEIKTDAEAALYTVDSNAEYNKRSLRGNRQIYNQEVINLLVEKTDEAFRHLFIKNKDSFSRIIPKNYTNLTQDEENTANYTPDFIIDLPKAYRNIKGLIIETDPEAGQAGMDFLAIEKKKALAERFQYKYIYIKKEVEEEAVAEFENFTFNDYFDRLKKNFELPLYGNTSGKNAMQYVLSPIAIARIQKIITECIFSEKLNPDSKKWTIGVIERDVPAAYIAVHDLKKQFDLICQIQGISKRFPDTELDIYTNSEFADAKLHKACKKETLLMDEFKSEKKYDLLLDISMLNNGSAIHKFPKNSAKTSITIHSVDFKKSNHKFYFGNTLSFFSNDEENEKPRRQALNLFSQNILRIPALSRFEMKTCINNLIGQNTVVLQSTNSKPRPSNIIYSLLNPGISVYLFSNNISMLDYFDEIRKLGIQASFYLNGIQHKLKEKNYVRKLLQNGEAIFLLVTTDYIRTRVFRETVQQIKENKLNFSSVFCTDISAVSEFSSAFNPANKGIKPLCEKLFKSEGYGLPIFSETIHSDYSIIEDIKSEVGLDTVINKKEAIHNIDVKTITAKEKGISDKGIILRKAFENKQKELETLITKLSEKEKLLVIYPFKNSYGNNYSQNLFDSHKILSEKFSDLNIASFTETGLFDSANFNTDDYSNSKSNYADFKDDNCDVLLATEHIIYGSEIKNLKTIIVFNTLPNAEEFYRLLGKFDSSYSDSRVYILNDTTELNTTEVTDTATEDGKQEVLEQMIKTTPDLFVRAQKMSLRFIGREKETTTLDELFDRINIPKITPAKELESALYNEFEIETKLFALPENNPSKLYVGSGVKTYGYHDFEQNITKIGEGDFNNKISLQVLNFTINEIKKHSESPIELLKHFHTTNNAYTVAGLESRLNKMKVGNSSFIDLYSHNGVKETVIELLATHSRYEADVTEIEQLIIGSDSKKDFIRKLKQRCNINVVNKKIDLQVSLEQLYSQYRNYTISILAVSRLIELGIVDDYITDRNTHKLTIVFSKHTDSYYKGRLKHFLMRQLAEEKAEEIFEQVENYSGKSLLRKILNYVINFSYREIRERDTEQAENMVLWSQALSRINDEYTRRSEIRNYFHSVFKAKYLNPLGKPSIIDETENFETGDFDTVMLFIYRAEYLKSRIEHLYLSSDKAQKIHPANYIVLLLNAFARFRKQKTQKEFDTAFNRLYLGFDHMEKEENLDYEETIRRKQLFLDILYKYNQDLKEKTDPLIYLKTHTERLSAFNKSFLKGLSTEK
ncbi:MAG: hypothetical protein U9N85_01660 [Bacteroidota bacterium]|nr:hypothetical protein [Bacteroidota bacterium]